MITVPWDCPPPNYVNLNTDGATNHLGFAGVGGVLRDDLGKFIAAYAQHIFRNNNNMAELRAIKEGLILAYNMRKKQLIVESDSTYVIILCEGK
ncbi:hypothetical protein MKW98_028946, partial [Papaver atlanticum]